MSCDLAQEMWSRMETAYSETPDEIAPVLWRKFYGSKIQQGQSVMEFMTEMEQIVSRLRAINGIALEDGQIITQILMSLPPSLKLNFVVAWDSTPAQEKTVKNLTTRLVKLEKNVKQSEEENSSNALVSMRVSENKNSGESEEKAFPVRDNKLKRGNEDKRKCWECGDDSHVRAKCRIFKRRLEREEDDRNYKRRRYEPSNRENNRHHDRNSESRDKRHDNRNRRDENRGRREHSYSAMQSRDNNNNKQ
ncbi:serine/threonine-protein kinase prpf4B-like [Daphnia magna]|uniref:serine/threonine-protein kinase prpf4B-like n=1 Tax=Daphnia magna TaxID=35525 RepID=UPI001E1BCED3|nr:serine/threonine-protein kinase prpf4B-like [Daphnia magna]